MSNAIVRDEPYRWVTPLRGSVAHLLPASSAQASNPKALCRRRVRTPGPVWGVLCPDCWELSAQFDVDVVE